MAFLDALVAEGRTEEALGHAPRQLGGTAGGAVIYGFDGAHFSLRPDAEGDVWLPEWPVCMVDWHGAQAYAAFAAIRTGQPWQLPGELAWEKAARGVDGRFYPWGDGFDPSWASMRRSHRGRMLSTAVGAFPVDESPYGIRDLAGSMMDWCSDAYEEAGPPAASARHALATQHVAPGQATSRVFRGGGWVNTAEPAYPAAAISAPSSRSSNLGFRSHGHTPGPRSLDGTADANECGLFVRAVLQRPLNDEVDTTAAQITRTGLT